MKFAKVVILASALAVPTFSISGFAKAADTQTIIVQQADRTSAEAEKSKADGLQVNIGKFCVVTILRPDSPSIQEQGYNGTLKGATTAWLILEQEDEMDIKGKLTKIKSEVYLPMKDVYTVVFQPKADD